MIVGARLTLKHYVGICTILEIYRDRSIVRFHVRGAYNGNGSYDEGVVMLSNTRPYYESKLEQAIYWPEEP